MTNKSAGRDFINMLKAQSDRTESTVTGFVKPAEQEDCLLFCGRLAPSATWTEIPANLIAEGETWGTAQLSGETVTLGRLRLQATTADDKERLQALQTGGGLGGLSPVFQLPSADSGFVVIGSKSSVLALDGFDVGNGYIVLLQGANR